MSTAATKSERTRMRILDAAAQVLGERGYVGTRLTDIARLADIQAPAIYYYWESRTELITEVVRLGNVFTLEHVSTALDDLPADTAPMDRIVAAAVAHLRSLLEISHFATASIRLMSQLPPDIRAQQLEVQERYADLWRELIDDARRADQLREGLDPAIARMMVLGALNWVPEWWDPARGTIDDLVADAAAMVRGALS